MVPAFEGPIDVVRTLRNYSDQRFLLDRLEPGSDGVIGALRFHAEAHDLDAAMDIEKQLRDAISFSYKDGVFTFSAIVSCSEEQIEVAEQFLQHYALAFLGTIGPGIVRPCI